MPRQGRAEEVLISELMSRRFDVHVGDRLDVVLLTSEEAGEGSRTAAPEHGVTIELVVTGVGVSYDEVIPFNDLNEAGSILATRALAALVDPSDWNFEGAFIDVTPGTDLQRLAAEIEGMGDADGAGSVFVSDQRAEMAVVSDSIRPLAIALAVSAAALALVALVVVGQALSRSQQEPRSEVDAVRAMGVRPRDPRRGSSSPGPRRSAPPAWGRGGRPRHRRVASVPHRGGANRRDLTRPGHRRLRPRDGRGSS